MRGIGNHTPPADMQPEPADNTERYVMAQAQHAAGTAAWWSVEWWALASYHAQHGTYPVIHTESAREIAAWWASLGTDGIDFAEFASSGTITEDLDRAIEREIAQEEQTLRGPDVTCGMFPAENIETNLTALRALRAYVRACTVQVWTVGKNMAGYLPEGDVYAFIDYADAVQAYREMIDNEAPEDVARTDECECGDSDELCELCSVAALCAAHIGDDVNAQRAGTLPLGIVIAADSWAGSMSYWLNGPETMTYGEFLDTRDGS